MPRGNALNHDVIERIFAQIEVIPRKFIEAEKIDWEHNDDLYLTSRTIEGKKGIFIFKKEA